MPRFAPVIDFGAARKIVVVRALQLGDLLCAAPTFRALRQAAPNAEIALAGLPWAREFQQRFAAFIDRFIEFPGYPGLPERTPAITEIPTFLARMQAEQFDLAVQLHGSGSYVNSLAVLFGARQSAGFFVPGEYCPDTHTYCPWPRSGLEIHRLLTLMRFVGIPEQEDAFEFPLTADDEARLFQATFGELDGVNYACIHPGASCAGRRWPVERFIAVADWLARQGFAVVLTGVARELPLAAEVAGRMKSCCINLAGKTDLGSLGVVVRGAKLLVANDTGISHIAAGLRTPSVIVSTGDNPARWAPIDTARHRVLCSEAGVGADAVIAAADELLANFPAETAA